MATPGLDVAHVVQVAAQAAQDAAQAATVLQQIAGKKDSGSKFSEAGKVAEQPEPYGTDDMEQDISKWTEFYDNFRAWLFYAAKDYEGRLRSFGEQRCNSNRHVYFRACSTRGRNSSVPFCLVHCVEGPFES